MESRKKPGSFNVLLVSLLVILFMMCMTGIVMANDESISESATSDNDVQSEEIDAEAETSKTEDEISDSNKTIEDGDYTIASHEDNNYVVDIYKNGTSSGTNLQMYQANGGTNQRMRIKYISEDGGYYRITSAVSGLSFDVYNSKNAAKKNGANVQLYTPSTGDNQKWAITKLSDGGYKIWSLISGKVLDIFGGSPRNEANVRTWDENDSPGQVFDFIRLADAPSNKTVDGGDYVISNVNNEFKVVDVYKGCSSSKNGSNV